MLSIGRLGTMCCYFVLLCLLLSTACKRAKRPMGELNTEGTKGTPKVNLTLGPSNYAPTIICTNSNKNEIMLTMGGKPASTGSHTTTGGTDVGAGDVVSDSSEIRISATGPRDASPIIFCMNAHDNKIHIDMHQQNQPNPQPQQNQQLEELKKKHETQLEALKEDHEAQLDLEKNHKAQLEGLEKKYEAQLALEKDHEVQLEALKKEHKAQLERLKEDYEEQLEKFLKNSPNAGSWFDWPGWRKWLWGGDKNDSDNQD